MMKVLYMSGMLALALIAFMPRGDGGTLGKQEVRAAMSPEASERPDDMAGNGIAEVVLKRASDGHYYARAEVNGAEIRFLVDSGASIVALSREDAARAGIPVNDGEFTDVARTASGTVPLKPVMIDRISIGPVVAERVRAAVLPGEGISLLGQSFLTRIRQVEISNGEMRLR
ncbi:retropepsin-like aspartic protease family protein [Sphingobium boeckii]|uniref:Aspartyl protease family protein n=1 Tax=Sphingobium boeckii TaxID=1082345 RepID=A0A7W9EF99_9SPHN|nr:TIGR02281 family clan AA aspartic protease [Sphingobium boeckii]MBB5686854.1 aspartyl protease family protein [Sphingobium boeckii]